MLLGRFNFMIDICRIVYSYIYAMSTPIVQKIDHKIKATEKHLAGPEAVRF